MDRTLEDTFYILFTTRAFATGVPTTLAGTPVVSAYEDAGLTQITAGITLGVDHDGVTGLNLLTIVATAANGYGSGQDYGLVITTGTVGGVSVVGEAVGSFSLSLSAASVDLANATDGLGALKAIMDTSGVVLTAAATSSQLVDDIWNEAIAGHLTAGTIGLSCALGSSAIIDTTASGTPTSTTLVLTAGSSIDDFYNDQLIYILSGTGVGQVRTVLDYTGSTKTVTVDEPWITTPIATDRVAILVDHVHPITQIAFKVWDEILTGATHNVNTSAGKRLRQIDAAFEVHSGTAQAGTATTITLDAGASASNDIYRGDRIIIVEGTGTQEHGICISYNGTTKVATMAEAWIITPDNTSLFEVVPASVDVETWQHNVVTVSASGLPDVNVNEVGDTAQTAGDLAGLITGLNNVAATDIVSGGAINTTGGSVDNVTLTDTVTTYTGNTPQTGDNYARLGAPAGADMSADIAAVKADTAAILIDTNELQGDWTNGGRLDLILDAILDDTGTSGVVLTAAERTSIADAVLDRDMATGTDSGSPTVRTVRQALRSGRNKVTISGGTMTVYKENDTTASWTAAVTTTAGDPISDIDPA